MLIVRDFLVENAIKDNFHRWLPAHSSIPQRFTTTYVRRTIKRYHQHLRLNIESKIYAINYKYWILVLFTLADKPIKLPICRLFSLNNRIIHFKSCYACNLAFYFNFIFYGSIQRRNSSQNSGKPHCFRRGTPVWNPLHLHKMRHLVSDVENN